MHHGRCCYCERLRDTSRESDIEHFRPKTEVFGKVPPKPGYWWLAYEWTNLLFACKTCNEEYKKTQFPIRGSRAMGPDDSLEEEDPFLLDPVSDDVEKAIGFDHSSSPGEVWVNGAGAESERGAITVRVLGLNRAGLRKERGDTHVALLQIARSMIAAQERGAPEGYIRKVGAQIKRMTSSKNAGPFIGMKRTFFKSFDLGEFVAKD